MNSGRPRLVVAVADVGEQAGQQRTVDRVLGRGRGVDLDLQGPDHLAELGVDVLPLPDAHEVEELRTHLAPERPRRQRPLAGLQVVPQRHETEEVGPGNGEPGVQLPGRLLLAAGALADILDGQRGGDHHDLVDAGVALGLEHHAPEGGVEGQAGQPLPEPGQASVVGGTIGLERAELLEQGHAVGDVVPIGWLDEGEGLDITQPEGGHLQDDRRQVGAQDLRLGELGPGAVVVLGVEPDAHAGGDPAAAAGPLVGRRLGDRLDREALDLGPLVVPGDPGRAGVDHRSDAGHGERGLGDVGGDDDPSAGMGREHPVLLGGRQAGEEGKHLGVAQAQPLDGVGGVADLPLARLEHQHVARHLAEQAGHGVGDRLRLVLPLVDRLVAHVHRIRPARDLDDRCRTVVAGEVSGEALRVDGGRGDDHLQVGPAREQLTEVAEDEVDVQAPLVGLVDDDRVVGRQGPVALELVEQDPVGHHLEPGVGADPVGEADGVAHESTHLDVELLRHPLGHRPGRDATGLGVTDASPAQFQADLGELRALARPGLTGDHDHLVVADGRQQLVVARRDRQFGRIRRRDRCGRCSHGRVKDANPARDSRR